MGIRIEIPQGNEALTEFVLFHDQVYDYRDARWPAPLELQLPILTGDSPFAQGRSIRPFLARAGSKIIARAVAVADERYNLSLARASRPHHHVRGAAGRSWSHASSDGCGV